MLLFLISIAMGGAFGLVYDLLYLFRLLSPRGHILSFLWDCLYLLACGVVTFLFLLTGNAGEVRLFILGGELLGFLLYRLTLGMLVSRAVRAFAAYVQRAAVAAGRCVKRPVVYAGRKMGKLVSQKYGEIKKTMPGKGKVSKLCLKPARELMYNLFHRTRRKAAGFAVRKRRKAHGSNK